MNKQKLTFVISVVVVCAVAFGVYATVREPGKSRSEPTIAVPEKSETTSVPFKTYTSSTAGVSFSIPEDWTVVPGKAVRIESPEFAEESIVGSEGKRVTVGAAVSLEKEEYLIDNSDEYVSLIAELHDDPKCGNCLTGHRITIGGIPAHLGFAAVGNSVEPNGAIISFVSGGNRYRLLMSFASYTELNQEILAEVIGTFELTK